MAVYICRGPNGCGRRVRGVVPKGGDGSAEVYVRHKKNRHSNAQCPNGRTVISDDNPAVEARPRFEMSEEAEVQLSGTRATWDNGVCTLEHICHRPIMRDDPIMRRGDGWAHVTCIREEHE
jgi:hypothetical protein